MSRRSARKPQPPVFLKSATPERSSITSKGRGETELRDLLAGTQSITYTQGAVGGYLIPLQYESSVFEALTQTDPLLDENVCDFVMEKSPTLQPKIIDGYDLSCVTAVQINEATQQTDGSFLTVKGGLLRGNIVYKLSLGVTWESDIDIPILSLVPQFPKSTPMRDRI